MAERSLPLVKVVRLEGAELSNAAPIDPPIIALAVLLLVGTAWWAASGK